jgi:hypothetical protein
LWSIYQLAPLAAIAVSVLPTVRILGLAIAILAFFLANLFFQVSLSVLVVLFTSEPKFATTEPYPIGEVAKDFTLLGFRLGKILPSLTDPTG